MVDSVSQGTSKGILGDKVLLKAFVCEGEKSFKGCNHFRSSVVGFPLLELTVDVGRTPLPNYINPMCSVFSLFLPLLSVFGLNLFVI